MRITRRFVHWLLVPGILGAVIFVLSKPPETRETAEVLRMAGKDVQLRTRNADVFAHFLTHSGGMELHVLIREQGPEGELLRTRVVLADGQSYEIRLNAEGEVGAAEFTFTRSGREIVAVADGAAPVFEGDYASWARRFL